MIERGAFTESSRSGTLDYQGRVAFGGSWDADPFDAARNKLAAIFNNCGDANGLRVRVSVAVAFAVYKETPPVPALPDVHAEPPAVPDAPGVSP